MSCICLLIHVLLFFFNIADVKYACNCASIMMQGHHFSLLQRETEKLKDDIEKMRSELRSVQLIVIIFI